MKRRWLSLEERIRGYRGQRGRRGGPKAAALLGGALLSALGAVVVALVITAAATALPEELSANRGERYQASLRITDRNGVLLREVRAKDGSRARFIRSEEVGDAARRAIIAAEDSRFRWHPGIDPLAIARALAQNLWERRVVSGASTLTQQLARSVWRRPRTLSGKFREAALALRIEWSLSKERIFEEYINRVSFGPGLRGIEAASRFYFGRATKDLSLAEAALLASMPRGPSLYDPRRAADRVLRRRDRVLDRMLAQGLASADEVARAKAEKLSLVPAKGGFGAPHFVQALLSGALTGSSPTAATPNGTPPSILKTTLDADLQRELEIAARRMVDELAPRHVSAASIVVIDHRTGEILAYVGSPDASDEDRLGANDGARARRQPGSTLKPFLYELAFEKLGFTASTILPDIELRLLTAGGGSYQPNNYDRRFHGPVRLRDALGNSFNVPAVWTANEIGPSRLLARLRDLGFASLDRPPDDYGPALALGDGEVTLLELTNAYATLARGGSYLPLRPLMQGAAAEPRRLLDETRARVIADILRDRDARLASFGERSVLELPFPVAAKTGTSKGFRDNFTVGFADDVTVGVWVGNFDGSAMHGVSGVTGAGPLFRTAMLAAHGRARAPAERAAADPGFETAEICPLSGALAGPACPHHRTEIFAPGTAPRGSCSMHVLARIDRRNGELASPDCPRAFAKTEVFESFPARFAAWAREAARPLVPTELSPLCGSGANSPPAVEHAAAPDGAADRAAVLFPFPGVRFVAEDSRSAPPSIVLRATAPAEVARVRFVVDGQRSVERPPPFVLTWPLVRGAHRVQVEPDRGAASDVVEFVVD